MRKWLKINKIHISMRKYLVFSALSANFSILIKKIKNFLSNCQNI